jgi:hypothetical protein
VIVKYQVLGILGAPKEMECEFKTRAGSTLDNIRKVVEPHLQGGRMERVRVFHNDIYTDMFVDDNGQEKNLPRNEKATRIYRNNVLTHEPGEYPDPEVLPYVYGPAVLFLTPVWS